MQNISHVQAYNSHTNHAAHVQDRDTFREYYHGYGDKHPAVQHSIDQFGCPEASIAMARQKPMLAEDKVRVAYFQTPDKEQRNLQTVTTVGKYIKRYWPDLSDHVIRDIDALFGPDDIKILDKMEDMVAAIQTGPESCMQWQQTVIDGKLHYAYSSNYRTVHPYHAYCPSLGWKLVVRRKGEHVVGRALINDKVFVRSYAKPKRSGSYSETDQKIEAYLFAQGFDKESSWPEGTRLLKVNFKEDWDFIVPFLDPGSDEIARNGRNLRQSGNCLVRDDQGPIEADNTDGTYSTSSYDDEDEDENMITCEDCDDWARHDDTYHVLRHGDRCVCSSCHDDYTFVYGKDKEQYYIKTRDAITVGNESFDPEYLDDNEIVELYDGSYASHDEAVYVESCGDYYHCDDVSNKECNDAEVVILGDSQYELKADCKWCFVKDEWCLELEMTELKDYWVHDDELEDHLFSLSQAELEDQYKDWKEFLPEWQAHHMANNPAQFVLEMEGA